MNRKLLLTFDDYFFSDFTDKNKYDSSFLTNSYHDSNEALLSINNSAKYIYHNILLDTAQSKNERDSPCHNIKAESNKLKYTNTHNYTKNMILHFLNDNKNTNSFYKKGSKGVQHIILKSSKNNETTKKAKKEMNENNNENRNRNSNSKVLNSKNIIRVVLSSEKVIKNFPMEYLNEMMCDLCTNLYKYECCFDKIRTTQNNLYGQQYCFFDKRISNFNYILHLSFNSCIKEATLFLAFVIFDRYSSKQPINKDESFIINIISFAIAIKYMESNAPNLDLLYNLCRKKAFSKEQINKYEIDIMEKLNYNISIPTIFDLFQFIRVIKNMNLKDYNLGLFFLEMFYISGGALKYNAIIVVEALYLIILEINDKEKRSLNLYSYMADSGINIKKYNEDIAKCLLEIKKECIHLKEKNYAYLVKKFASEKYQKISVDFQLL